MKALSRNKWQVTDLPHLLTGRFSRAPGELASGLGIRRVPKIHNPSQHGAPATGAVAPQD